LLVLHFALTLTKTKSLSKSKVKYGIHYDDIKNHKNEIAMIITSDIDNDKIVKYKYMIIMIIIMNVYLNNLQLTSPVANHWPS